MVSPRRVIGVVVVVLGLLTVALGFTVLNSSAVTVPERTSGSVAAFKANIFGGGTVTISWTGADPQTTVTMYSCPGDSSCSQQRVLSQLNLVAAGTGSSGSLSASILGGTTYLMVENGTSGSVVTTAQVTGISLTTIIGIVVAVIGVVLVVLPTRRKVGAGSAAEVEAPADEETFGAPMPEAGTPAAAPVAMEAEPGPEEAPAAPVGTGMSAGTSSETSAAQANARGRPNRTCAHCGAINEPWITNCRRCKRPLSNTG